MFKFVILISSFLIITSAFAAVPSELCKLKQKNKASLTLAQEIGVTVQSVKVVKYLSGDWSARFGDNEGFDLVEVEALNTSGDKVKKRYLVNAEQIGITKDCKIVLIMQDTL